MEAGCAVHEQHTILRCLEKPCGINDEPDDLEKERHSVCLLWGGLQNFVSFITS